MYISIHVNVKPEDEGNAEFISEKCQSIIFPMLHWYDYER